MPAKTKPKAAPADKVQSKKDPPPKAASPKKEPEAEEPVEVKPAPAAPPKPAEPVERIEDYYDYGTDSSSDEEGGPPPVMQIEREVDLGTLHKAFTEMKDKPTEVQKAEIVERFGKEALTSIASAFESGGPEREVDEETVQQQERHKLIHIEKDKYDSFKSKFENIDQEMEKTMAEKVAAKRRMSPDEVAVDKEALEQAKNRFEGKVQEEPTERKAIDDVHRSEEDKQRIKKTFVKAHEKEEPKDCAICGKTVYFAERLPLEGRVFHQRCFKCSKCGHGLSVQNYYTFEGQLYCKVHILDFVKPGMNPENWAEAADEDVVDEEEDYAIVSKPKVLDPNIVRSGLKTTDDLGQVPNLRSVKNKWETSAEEAQNVKLRTEIESDILEPGKVKARMSKFADGHVEEEEEEEEEDRDPNIIREDKRKKKEQPSISVEVGSIKSKWETGTVETAASELEDRSTELEEIKKSGVPVRDRFKEGQAANSGDRTSILEAEGIDFKTAGATRERFKTGELFQSGPVERTTQDEIEFKELGSVKDRFEKGGDGAANVKKEVVDVRCEELGNIKAAFETGPKAEDDNEQRKKAISDEFQQFKAERRALREKELAERQQQAEGQEAAEKPDDVKCAELGNIKQRFEEGTAFKSGDAVNREKDDTLEYKVAGKAREKFKQIDQDQPAVPMQQPTTPKDSKWATDKTGPAPEPVNKRVLAEDDDNEPEDFELRNIISKFKTLEQGPGEEQATGPKEVRRITPPPGEYKAEFESQAAERDPNVVTGEAQREAVHIDAKNLKQQFEQLATTKDEEDPEEHRKRLEEEFRLYKEMKEKQKLEQPEEPEEEQPAPKDDVQVAAEHAAKMKQKFEKIQRKEAKKAQKSTMKRPAAGRKSEDGEQSEGVASENDEQGNEEK